MPAAAIIAVVGAVVAVGAGTAGAIINAQNAKDARNSANAQAEEERRQRKEQLDFAKKQYARWEQDFGEIQTEVAEYYKNLSDDILKQQYEDANTEANQSLLQQYFQAQYNIKSNMNKAGMAGSGAEQSSNLQLQQSLLLQKAQNRWQTEQLKANANNQIMGQKANWANQGQALYQTAATMEYSTYQDAANSASAKEQMYRQMEASYKQAMINNIVEMGATVGGAMITGGAQMASANLTASKPTTTTIPTTNSTWATNAALGFNTQQFTNQYAQNAFNSTGNFMQANNILMQGLK